MDIDINNMLLKLKENKFVNSLFFQEETSKEYIVLDIGTYNVKFCYFSLNHLNLTNTRSQYQRDLIIRFLLY